MFSGSSGIKDGLDVNGHVPMGTAESAHNGESQSLLASLELDRLNCPVQRGARGKAAVSGVRSGSPIADTESAHAHVDLALRHLEDGRGLLLRGVGEVIAVDGEDLVALYEASVAVRGAALHHLGDEHARPRLLAHNGEAKTAILLL